MKHDKRKTIMVEEAQFKLFDERRKALGKNSTELLSELMLNGSYEETLKISNRIEPDTAENFEKNINELNKAKGW